MLFLRHPAWLWLKKHDKAKLPAIGEALQAIFDDGHLFEEYAERLFPEGVKLGFNGYQEYLSLPLVTKNEILKGTEIILQGRIEADNITCIFDVIKKVGEKEFDLYEIKSSTEAKEEHVLDLAFQTIVLENAGLNVRNLYVIHVNRNYVRSGDIDINQLIVQVDVTDKVRAKLDKTREDITKAISIMFSSTPPDFSPRHVGLSALDEWMAIYEAMFPQEHPHNIFKLTRINPELIGQLEDLGVKTIADIPENLKLHPKQKIQVQVTKDTKRVINKERIREFLSQFKFPLYFFDYETFSAVIPPFDGIRPYQQVPFQYSLHILDKPGGIMVHKEFLHVTNTNPCQSLIDKLKKDIGENGTILVWYEVFEKGRNSELAEMFPEYFDFMNGLNVRILDLMVPFSNNWFVDKDFFGSASIKKVFPVLITELSYKNLAIQEGETASRTWKEMIFDGKYAERKDELIKQLLEYCQMDTLAMVQLYNLLLDEIKTISPVLSDPVLTNQTV
jgi:hypothetical protein